MMLAMGMVITMMTGDNADNGMVITMMTNDYNEDAPSVKCKILCAASVARPSKTKTCAQHMLLSQQELCPYYPCDRCGMNRMIIVQIYDNI